MWSPLDERFQPPSEPDVIGKCAWCGGEIYAGDPVTIFADGERTHDGECEEAHMAAELGRVRTIAE
jgi:hypothetical protein